MSFRAVTAEDAAQTRAQEGRLAGLHEGGGARAAAGGRAGGRRGAGGGRRARRPLGVPDAYPGDDAPQPEIAAWMAKQAEARGLPPELPIMASLVESGMKNLNFGHADSVGFFQMRVGIWNQGDYAGYPEKPELQVKWFLDEAEEAKDARIAAGKPVDDPSSYGEWIADTERPAEQYRYKYQTKLEEAQGLLEQAPKSDAAAAGAAGRRGDARPRRHRRPPSRRRGQPGCAGRRRRRRPRHGAAGEQEPRPRRRRAEGRPRRRRRPAHDRACSTS